MNLTQYVNSRYKGSQDRALTLLVLVKQLRVFRSQNTWTFTCSISWLCSSDLKILLPAQIMILVHNRFIGCSLLCPWKHLSSMRIRWAITRGCLITWLWFTIQVTVELIKAMNRIRLNQHHFLLVLTLTKHRRKNSTLFKVFFGYKIVLL